MSSFLYVCQSTHHCGHRAYANVEPYLDGDREGLIPTLYLLRRLLNNMQSAEETTFQFTALDFTGDNVIVNGRVLYLRDIHSFVDAIISEVKDHISNELLFSMDVVDINWTPGVIHEEPRNTRLSYSAFDDPRNSFQQYRNTLLKFILTEPRLQGVFHYVDPDNRIVWKAGPCFAYMDVAHMVEMKLFAGSHVTAGEPAQAVDMASYLVRNNPGGTLRNIIFLFQHFCMMGKFRTTDHFNDKQETMIRVPLPEIGRLWMLFETVIRPLVFVWQQYFNGSEAAARVKYTLFSGPHRPVTASELSRNLSMHFNRIVGIKMPINLWRHIVKWFISNNYERFRVYLTTTSQSILAMQSGHNVVTHSLYASDARLPNGINSSSVFQAMSVSGVWHALLGFPRTLLDSITTHCPTSVSHTQPHSRAAPSQNNYDRVVVERRFPTTTPTKSIAKDVATQLITEFTRMQSLAHEDVFSFADLICQDPPTTTFPHPSLINALRQFLQNENAHFKHPQQAQAAELMAKGDVSFLLVGPTGILLHSIDWSPVYLVFPQDPEKHFLFNSVLRCSIKAKQPS